MDCVMCNKEINTDKEQYSVGESLGEYWCEKCVETERGDKFICTKCNTEWERSEHYKAIVHNQNMINMMMGNPKIIVDLCGKCNHMVEKK